MAQLRLETPGVAAKGDRFVIRRYSPVVTLGGGVVLDASPSKHVRLKEDIIDSLRRLEHNDPKEVLDAKLRSAGWSSRATSDVATDLAVSETELKELVTNLAEADRVRTFISGGRERHVHAENFGSLEAEAIDSLGRYHEEKPLSSGLRRRELQDRIIRHTEDALYEAVVDALIEEGRVAADGPLLRLADHQIELDNEQAAIRDSIIEDLVSGGAAPPDLSELSTKHSNGSLLAIVEAMRTVGDVVRLDDGLLFAPRVLEDIETKMIGFLQDKGEMGVADFRDLVNTTRKYAVPLLNYFDGRGVTERQGDVRILRETL